MISKAEIKQVKLLHQKKYREEKQLFVAEGPKVVKELLQSKYNAKEIFATDEFQVSIPNIQVRKVNEKELKTISTLTTPNQVLAVFEIPSPLVLQPSSLSAQLLLALDDIRDPGNLGTIIRIADWFGIKNLLCSESCVDLFNPKVVQASMGSIARVNVYYENLESTLLKTKSFLPVYGATMDGENIYSQGLSSCGIILIGNESKGVSKNLLTLVSQKISIPKFSHGADSLNAAVATAVICSEFRRRS
ncbi:MAG: RNA methyltransferase [Bacteroidetes bacterium]|nr:RNA methyltransferase [Bacteroidota bacterium]